MKKQIQSFINLFGGKNQIVASNGKNLMFKCSLTDALEKNKSEHDIYFVISPSTGLKDSDVTHLSCNYVDLDAGKDSAGNYLSDSLVRKFKNSALKKISQFSVSPTAIVETRNGYHVYWNYKQFVPANYLNRKHWKDIQYKIFSYFSTVGSDKAVQKVNQLLRVPHTYWHKTWSGKKKSFLVKVIKITRKQSCYKFENLITSFAAVNAQTTPSKPNYNNCSYNRGTKWKVNTPPPAAQPVLPSYTRNSYTKRTDWNGTKKPIQTVPAYPSQALQTNEQEIVDFLNDLSQVLYSKNMRYFSNQCKDIANKIRYK